MKSKVKKRRKGRIRRRNKQKKVVKAKRMLKKGGRGRGKKIIGKSVAVRKADTRRG